MCAFFSVNDNYRILAGNLLLQIHYDLSDYFISHDEDEVQM